MKKELKLKVFPALILIVSILFIIIGSILLIKENIDNRKIKEIEDTIIKDTIIEKVEDTEQSLPFNPPEDPEKDDYRDYIKVPLLNVSFNDLLQKNKETVGWLQVNGTSINYPVVQAKDNIYYLTHAFDQSKNSAGWVFADYRNNIGSWDSNTIIYAHGRVNQTMFGTLNKVLNNSWQNDKSNHIVHLSTPKENTSWQVFSIYTIKTESYYITTSFNSDNAFSKFLTTMQDRSIKAFSVSLNTKDKILTLSTCKDKDKRIVLHAKLIKTQKITN